HRQPYPQLGPFLANLEELLERNGRQPARDRLDKRQLFEALRRTGYAGGYDAVRRYARRWADIRATKTEAKATEAFIPLTFAPAEAYQFDWSEEAKPASAAPAAAMRPRPSSLINAPTKIIGSA